MRRKLLSIALSALIGAAPHIPARASTDRTIDKSHESTCRDGYETRNERTNKIFVMQAVPCGDNADTRQAIKVTVPRCDNEPITQERNIKAGQDYFRFLADHARQSYRRNKEGFAAYARNEIDEPFYNECAAP